MSECVLPGGCPNKYGCPTGCSGGRVDSRGLLVADFPRPIEPQAAMFPGYDQRVVPLFSGPTEVRQKFPPKPELVVELKRLLAEAESGSLRSLAYAMVHHDELVAAGQISTAYVFDQGTSFALGEAISRLRRRWDIDRDKDIHE